MVDHGLHLRAASRSSFRQAVGAKVDVENVIFWSGLRIDPLRTLRRY